MAKKALDAKAKEKRQKMMAVVLAVAFLAVAAFQFPRMWKMMHPKPPSQPTVVPTASSPPPNSPLPTSLAGAPVAQPVAATSPTAGAPAPSAGQLVSFGRFSSKNPFVQQVDAACDTDPTGSAPGCPTTGGTGTTTTSGDSTGSTVPGKKPAPKPKPPASPTTPTVPAAPTQAVISVNGSSQTVAIGGQFPTASPTFVLRSVGRKRAKIGIVGGSYSDGSQAVTLTLGKKLTLMNTADGSRYVLILVSVA
jgi:hypothetical protein